MTRRFVLAMTSRLLLVVSGLLLAPAGVAWVDGDRAGQVAYLATAVATVALALALRLLGRGAPATMHRKDAFGVVALTWACLGVVGAVPMLLDGSLHDPASALFESVSGFTTTGATVIADVDALSRATNLWRCLMHWVGGMGIVVLFVAIFPLLGVGAKQLFRTEVAGPITEGLRLRVREIAVALWWIYAGLTAACAALLWLQGMTAYDAVCHAFSTLGTGGYSTRTASLGAWDDPGIHWTVAAFMLLAGCSFGLYHGALRGHWRELYRNAELRFYLGVNALVTAVLFLSILPRHGSPLTALRHAAFQTLAVTTTSGFATEDFDAYSDVCRLLLFAAMFMGGCAGSTAGGMKASRVLLLLKLAARELRRSVQPAGVFSVRLGRQAVPEGVLSSVLVFSSTFLGLYLLGALVLLALGTDLLTGMSASIACLSSIGPGLAGVGPSHTYAHLPAGAKLVLSFLMVAGRLELFALLAVFTPECWRR